MRIVSKFLPVYVLNLSSLIFHFYLVFPNLIICLKSSSTHEVIVVESIGKGFMDEIVNYLLFLTEFCACVIQKL